MTEPNEPQPLSNLLALVGGGDPAALASLFERAYPELRALASARLRGRGLAAPSGPATTTLVHETFLRIAQRAALQVENRAHFFKYAGRVMRSIIVDIAREQLAKRRGGGAAHVALTTQVQPDGLGGEEEILHVHQALDGLADYDPRLIEVVQLRYFGGLTDSEIATVLSVTDRTVRRDWEKARVLLMEALET